MWSRAAEEQAREHDLEIFKDRSIAEDDHNVWKDSGHPENPGIHVGRRRGDYEDDRKDKETAGYVARAVAGKGAGESARCLTNEKWCGQTVAKEGTAQESTVTRN